MNNGNNSLVAGLTINFSSTYDKTNFVGAIYADGVKNVKVQDVNLNITSKSTLNGFCGIFGIVGINKAEVEISGHNKIDLSGNRAIGIFAHNYSKIDISGQTDFSLGNDNGWGIWAHTQSTVNINSDAALNLNTSSCDVLILNSIAFTNIKSGASLSMSNSSLSDAFRGIMNEYDSSEKNYKEGNGITLEKGVNLSVKNAAMGIDFGGTFKDGMFIDTVVNGLEDPNNYPDEINKTGASQTYTSKKDDETTEEDQYKEIINQYDALIKDASYKGINLLQTDKLSVKFNEDNAASLNVQGKDMSSQALGFTASDWKTQEDIAKSLSEIASALKSISNYSAELGNNYSIITTRQDFTESLINVLTEGADKLTLADMNEESANMLALQTRQQLAINSLSLASQASQSILKLF